jgi:hypothetical protein
VAFKSHAEVTRALKHTELSTMKLSSLPKIPISWTLAPMGVEERDAAIHYPLALFCRKEHLFAPPTWSSSRMARS